MACSSTSGTSCRSEETLKICRDGRSSADASRQYHIIEPVVLEAVYRSIYDCKSRDGFAYCKCPSPRLQRASATLSLTLPSMSFDS
jgi:hypothetical protein